MSKVPEHLRYRDSHEWIETGKEPASVGITDHAQSELSDLVYVELPSPGRTVEAGEAVAVVESVKAASDVYSPVSGEVTEANPAIADDPSVINNDPEGEGWFFKLRLSDPAELEGLMDEASYREWCETL